METKEEVINYLLEQGNDNYTEEEFNNLSSYDLFDEYLNWNGIIGYTDEIQDVFKACYNLNNRNSRMKLNRQLQLCLAILEKNNLLEEFYAYNEENYEESEPVDIDWNEVKSIEEDL